jgi:hypothetical protein
MREHNITEEKILERRDIAMITTNMITRERQIIIIQGIIQIEAILLIVRHVMILTPDHQIILILIAIDNIYYKLL